ncbi:hypothetical protein K439DRAFT_1612201 [Ramaria rubella]|nr:hypothetical protein K439DRAFT_1612201 [Ramaria rubella]
MIYLTDYSYIRSFKITLFSEVTADIGWGTSGLAVDIVSDFIIATSMIYRLNKGKTSFRRTNSAINLLIKYVLNTCLLTGFCNIVNMVLFIVESDNLIYTPFYFLLIRLYSCSLMSTLNSRDNVRKELDAHRTGGVVNMSSFILRTLDSDETATAGSMKLDNKWMSNKPNTQTGTIDSV